MGVTPFFFTQPNPIHQFTNSTQPSTGNGTSIIAFYLLNSATNEISILQMLAQLIALIWLN